MEENQKQEELEKILGDTYVAICKNEEDRPSTIAASGDQQEIMLMICDLLYNLIQKGVFSERELANMCKTVINFKKPGQKRAGIAVCVNGFQVLIWGLTIAMTIGIICILINWK